MSIVGRLNKRAEVLRSRKQTGFTLLELLVVVAILAAIAGTAALALQDTDARASAAAHVAMMDELNKGIRSFRVLHRNSYPNNFDSLLQTAADGSGQELLDVATRGFDTTSINIGQLPANQVQLLVDIGIDNMRIVNRSLDGDGADTTETCADLQGIISSRGNAVVPGNIYLSPAANGCGADYDLTDGAADPVAEARNVAFWVGGSERLIGNDLGSITAGTAGTDVTCAAGTADVPVYLAVGLGPSSSLFDTTQLGGMTSVPVYRHVGETQYNRFIAIFQTGTCSAGTLAAGDQAALVAIVDGAGDTKEEELGEWDGTRNTI